MPRISRFGFIIYQKTRPLIWRFRSIMYIEHAPLFGGFIIYLYNTLPHWHIRVIIYIENVPLLGDSGSSYTLIKHVTCTLISRIGFIS